MEYLDNKSNNSTVVACVIKLNSEFPRTGTTQTLQNPGLDNDNCPRPFLWPDLTRTHAHMSPLTTVLSQGFRRKAFRAENILRPGRLAGAGRGRRRRRSGLGVQSGAHRRSPHPPGGPPWWGGSSLGPLRALGLTSGNLEDGSVGKEKLRLVLEVTEGLFTTGVISLDM